MVQCCLTAGKLQDVLPVACVDSDPGTHLQLSHTVQKNIHIRLIGDSKLSPGMSVNVDGCLSFCVPFLCPKITGIDR